MRRVLLALVVVGAAGIAFAADLGRVSAHAPEFAPLATINSGGISGTSNTSSLPDQSGNSGKYLTTDGSSASWATVSGGSGVTTMGAFGSTPNSNGGTISSTTLTLQPADATNPGGVSTTTQTFAGRKTVTTAANGTTPFVLTSTAASDARGGMSLNATGAAGAGVVQLSGADGALEVYTTGGDKVCLGTNNAQTDMCLDSSHNLAATTPGTDAITAGFVLRKNTTTSTTAPSVLLQLNRENSATAALRLGVDGNDDAVIGGNGAINLRFGTYSGSTFTEKATIKSDGTVKSIADIASTTNGAGLILKSPDGTCYRFTVANGGTLSSGSSVTCP